jgi:hypothetical protein
MSHVSPPSTPLTRLSPSREHLRDLGHPHDELAEVAPLQHSDESAWRVFETVDDVLAVANATRGDARTNLAQQVRIVLGGEDRTRLAIADDGPSIRTTGVISSLVPVR